jgi:hypothetical protein
MRHSNSREVIILCSHFKSQPRTPANSDTQELFNPLGLEVSSNFAESVFHLFEVLALDVGSDGLWIVGATIARVKELRHVDIVSLRGKEVCNNLMPATVDAEDILHYEQGSVARAHMIDLDPLNALDFTFGAVVDCQLRPGFFRTALHLDMFDYNEGNNPVHIIIKPLLILYSYTTR